MTIVFEQRASTILYRLLQAAPVEGVWLLPANVCPIVPLTLIKAGRAFELVDIDERTWCMNQTEAFRRLAEHPRRYAGVLFVRTYGLPDSFEDFFRRLRAAAPQLCVIDDRCVCWPTFDIDDHGPAHVVLYSTGYAKPVDLGFGGYAFLRHDVPCRRVELPYRERDLEKLTAAYKKSVQAREPIDEAPGDWLDTSEPPGSLGTYRDRVNQALPAARQHKLRLTAIYREGIPEDVCLDERFDGWRFHLRVPRRNALIAALFNDGLFAGSHYPTLTGIFAPGDAPVSERLHAVVVNLFNDGYYTEEQAHRTVDVVRRHLESSGR